MAQKEPSPPSPLLFSSDSDDKCTPDQSTLQPKEQSMLHSCNKEGCTSCVVLKHTIDHLNSVVNAKRVFLCPKCFDNTNHLQKPNYKVIPTYCSKHK